MDFLKGLVLPSNIILLLIVFGLLVRLFFGWRKLSYACLALSGLATLTLSSGFVATSLLSPLEYRYPALQDPSSHPDVKHIAVLTSYASDDRLMPLSSRVNSSAAFRVLEAFNLYQRCPDCSVIVTGEETTTRVTGELLVYMGVDASRLILEEDSYNTSRSAVNLKPVLGDNPFFLVTSAGHMPRSMGVFEKLGMKPVPAPTDYMSSKNPVSALYQISPMYLIFSDLAVHEYMAMAWFRLNDNM